MVKTYARGISESGPFAGRLSTVIVAVVVVMMVAALGVIIWQKSTKPAVADYDGTIVDRWADTRETELGSRQRWFLLVENDGGARFTARVDANTYESARVGMRIKSRNGQIRLIASDKTPQ
ncbi:MAG TPA: hypothetical protein VFZ40_08265 [Pyrinomonadaceae bacterium]